MEVLFAEIKLRSERIRIPFVCQQCGKCCKELGRVVVDPTTCKIYLEDHEKAIDYFDIKEIKKLQKEGIKHPVIVPCPFFENNKCKIYPFRPESCRKFPLTPDEDLGVGCPALKRLKEIIKKLSHEEKIKIKYCFEKLENIEKIEISEITARRYLKLRLTETEKELFFKLNKVKK